MTRATADSWKHLSTPTRQENLRFEAFFTDKEAEELMDGLVPSDMDDKWFVYFSEGWLLFHRSWTGACIYGLRLDGSPAGVRVTESWVNRDPNQYRNVDTEYDRQLLRFLIDAFLLQKPGVVFPTPRDLSSAVPGVFQHSAVGRAYPERRADEDEDK